MTFPHARRHRGFTLVELLVVIGIIVLLAGLGLPMVLRAYKSGTKMRSQADLQTITTALNAYKQDFGEYPRVPVPNTGPAVLCMALVGPFGDGQIRDPNNPTAPPTLDSNGPETSSPAIASATAAGTSRWWTTPAGRTQTWTSGRRSSRPTGLTAPASAPDADQVPTASSVTLTTNSKAKAGARICRPTS
jgi:prepilin-type N-terminal cleavage/methylation domain-containing protein